jgi:hypothetical protein
MYVYIHLYLSLPCIYYYHITRPYIYAGSYCINVCIYKHTYIYIYVYMYIYIHVYKYLPHVRLYIHMGFVIVHIRGGEFMVINLSRLCACQMKLIVVYTLVSLGVVLIMCNRLLFLVVSICQETARTPQS